MLVCLLVALGVSASTAPQDPAPATPPQVFRGGADLVYVDVYPRQNDKVIDGLTAQDFQVFEDGRPQSVQTFDFIRFEPSPIDAERRDPNSVDDANRQAADPKNRVFVVYLDRFHTSRQGARDSARPVLDFLNRTIGASDLFAVTDPETPVSRLTFARRTDTLEQELAEHRDWGLSDEMRPIIPRNGAEEQLTDCAFQSFKGDDTYVAAVIRMYREDETYTSLESLVSRLGDLRDGRKNLVMLTGGWIPVDAWPQLANVPVNQGSAGPPPIGVGPGGKIGIGNPQSRTGMTDTWCRGQLARLGSIDFARRYRDLIDAAERANVSVYPVDVGGLQAGGYSALTPAGTSSLVDSTQSDMFTRRQNATVSGLGPIASLTTKLEVLRTLAGATDGLAIVNTNDLSAGFRRITDRLSAYYLLGYVSTNAVTHGKFRKIDVKVNRPNVQIAARRGYRAVSAAEMAAAPVPVAVSAALAAVNAELGTLSRLGSDRETFSQAVFRTDGMNVVVELAARELERGRWTNGASVSVNVAGGAGAPIDVTTKIDAGRRAALVHVPLAGAGGGPLHVRVRVTGDQGPVDDRFDTTPPPKPDGLLDGGIVFRGALSARSILQPVGEFLFHRNERLHAEWPVLKALDSRTARVLDRKGQPIGSPLAMAERPADAGPAVASVDLPMTALADGDYLIEVTAVSGAQTDRKLIAFRVTR